MRRAKRKRLAHVLLALRHRLGDASRARRRQSEHQIKIHIANGLEPNLYRAPRFSGIVHATKRGQVRVVETLDTNRESRHAGRFELGKLLHLKGAGVRLQRNFGLRREARSRPHPRQNIRNRFRRKQARRTAADKHRVNRAPPKLRKLHFQVRHQRVDVLLLRQTAALFMRIEIAIRTLANAPRNVDVERERRENGEVGTEH